MAKLTRYKIANTSEEFQCHQCGCPVDVGDSALMVECNEREAEFPVCSKECNRRDLQQWQELN